MNDIKSEAQQPIKTPKINKIFYITITARLAPIIILSLNLLIFLDLSRYSICNLAYKQNS